MLVLSSSQFDPEHGRRNKRSDSPLPWRRDILKNRRNVGPQRMLPSRRRNLREERDSHHRGRSGVTPARSQSSPPFYRENAHE
jgi:hypothetical protein